VAATYQEAGALRDMIQNHLLQIMATIAMEPSATFQPDAVRDERAKLLRSIRIMKEPEILANSVAGQYGPARNRRGGDVPGSGKSQAWIPMLRPTPTPLPLFLWITGGGGCAVSISARASGFPRE